MRRIRGKHRTKRSTHEDCPGQGTSFAHDIERSPREKLNLAKLRSPRSLILTRVGQGENGQPACSIGRKQIPLIAGDSPMLSGKEDDASHSRATVLPYQQRVAVAIR